MSPKKKQHSGILFPPLVGYSFGALLKVLRANTIAPKYFIRVFFIVLINLINLPFRLYEQLFINPRFREKELDNPPIFIIGHWRSGTTHLHNLLSKDTQMGYVSTYQSVFPDTLFNKIGRWLFRSFMGILIPKKREGDNIVLNPKLPQEEEFTLGHSTPLSYYLFWFFPKKSALFFKHYLKFEGVDKAMQWRWANAYKLLIQKALKNTDGTMFLSKNPPNTARIEVLLELFPDAKFIHIHRNPVDVYLSTQNFFKKMMPHLQLEDISKVEINALVVSGYNRLMKDYLRNKSLIPKENLVELSFDELEANPMKCLEAIYKQLSIDGFEKARCNFEKYINTMSDYKKNRLSIDRSELDRVTTEWSFAMTEYNYEVPTNLEVI